MLDPLPPFWSIYIFSSKMVFTQSSPPLDNPGHHGREWAEQSALDQCGCAWFFLDQAIFLPDRKKSLYNSNVAKVSIVKWIFVDGNLFFGLLYDLEFALKTPIFKQKIWYARNDTPNHKNPNPRPLHDRYFWNITIIKWSQICQNSIGTCSFRDVFSKDPFSIKFPIIAVRALCQGEQVVKNGFQRVFLDLMTFLPHTNISLLNF